MPNWWYVFLADLRVRVSRFRFLKRFRYILPFVMLILFVTQFIILLTIEPSTTSDLIPDFQGFLDTWLFKIETIAISFLIFVAFNSSMSYFAQYTQISELEIISGSPISTRSYLFGKFLSLQVNNAIFTPFLMLAHLEIARLGGATVNWWYFIFYFIVISVLFYSISWLGITLGPKAVFKIKDGEDKQRNKNIIPLWVSIVIALTFFVPIILAFILTPAQYELGFTFLPQGWFAILARGIFNTNTINLIPILFGLLTLLFSGIFLIFAYFRTNYNLNLENYEALSGSGSAKAKTPYILKILDKIPFPYNYSMRAFYLINSRKRTLTQLVDIFFLIAVVGIIISGFIFPDIDWSTYILYGSLGVGFFLFATASTDGLQILFGGKNTFLICQSAPKGIRKMLFGKVIQLMISNAVQYLGLALLLLIFHTNKLQAILVAILIFCAIFNGLTTGFLSLSIAPFFETSDITSNPIRGLQVALPLNINITIVGGLSAIVLFLLGFEFIWVVFIILIFYFLLSGMGYLLLAQKLLQRFET